MKRIDIQRIRKDNKTSQKQLAEILGVPQSFVSQVENGKDPMPEYWPQKLAEHFNISDISDYEIDMQDGQLPTNNQQGNGNTYNSNDALNKALDSLVQQIQLVKEAHSLVQNAQRQTDKAQEQMDRLISIIENMQK